MQANIFGMFLNIEPRFGFGLDIESVESRPVWAAVNGEVSAYPFDGLILLVPFFIVSLGNIYTEAPEE
jgi:hypothetical protein